MSRPFITPVWTRSMINPSLKNLKDFRKMATTDVTPIGYGYRFVMGPGGLVLVLLVYSLVGAKLFEALEQPNEQAHRTNIAKTRKHFIQNLWKHSHKKNVREEEWKNLARGSMREFETVLQDAFADGVTSSSEKQEAPQVWNFWGAFMYCITVYTTIGYGHIYPSTSAGKLATIVYALIGVPLCLVVLNEVGKLFTGKLKSAISYIQKQMKTSKSKKDDDKTAADIEINDEFDFSVPASIGIMVFYLVFGAYLFTLWEDWSMLDAFYFHFITLSTLGFGDILPEKPKYFIACFAYILVGLALLGMVFNVLMEHLDVKIGDAKKKITAKAKQLGYDFEESKPALIEDKSSEKKEPPVAEINEDADAPTKDDGLRQRHAGKSEEEKTEVKSSIPKAKKDSDEKSAKTGEKTPEKPRSRNPSGARAGTSRVN